jgi:hypothetical protein
MGFHARGFRCRGSDVNPSVISVETRLARALDMAEKRNAADSPVGSGGTTSHLG